VGKKKKPKQDVTTYGMSIHFGVCWGPVDYLSNIIINEKQAWMPTWPRFITGLGTYLMDLGELFGGLKKEGGVAGSVTWLPGQDDQVMPEILAQKHGRTAATMPAYRGISSVFFSGPGAHGLSSFYWQANSPYLPGVWVEVARTPIGLSAFYARIYRSSELMDGPGLDFGAIGSGNDAGQWDTHLDWNVYANDAAGTIHVYSLPAGTERSFDPGTFNQYAGGLIHITEDGELFHRTGGDASGTDPTSFTVRSLYSESLAVIQTIPLHTWIIAAGGSDYNYGFAMDDIVIDGVGYALAYVGPALLGGPWVLLRKGLGAAWEVEWSQPRTFAGGSHLVDEISMGTRYAYCKGDTSATGFILVDWAGDTFSLSETLPAGMAGRSLRWVHYLQSSDEVLICCTNGDLLIFNPDLTVLKRQRTDLGAGIGLPGGMLGKRCEIGGNVICVPDMPVGSIGVARFYMLNVTTLATVKTITVDSTAYVNKDEPYDWCGINARWGSAFMAQHNLVCSTWFLMPLGPFDANPAHIIFECLINTDWGMGAPTSAIDVIGFEAAAVTLYNEGFGLSMIWTQQAAIEDFISEVLDHIEATLFVNPRNGLLTLKLIRNDYSVPALPVFTPDNAVVTNFSRKLWGETINEIIVTWTQPLNEENETVVAQDLANIEQQGGIVSDGRNYYGVRRSDLAMRLAQRDLRSASTPLAKCDMEINRTAWDLLPGDCCVLNSPEDGIDSIVMRVGPVDYGKPGDSMVRTSLVEDVFSLALADYELPPATAWEDSSEAPSPADFSLVLTLPYYITINMVDAALLEGLDYPEVFAGVLAAEDGGDTDSFELYGEVTDAAGSTGFADIGTKTIASHATLPGALAAEATSTILAFPDRTQGSGPVEGGLMLIEGTGEDDQELCLITGFGAGGYTFRRGVLDTVPRAWAAGASVWFIDEGMVFADDVLIRAEGETVDYKALIRTSLGLLDAEAAPIVSATMTGRPHLPLRPANVKVNGDDGFAGLVDCIGVDPIPVTWARRNRETETAIVKAWTDGDVTPETGQTTTVTLTDMDGVVLHTYSGIAGTSQNVDPADFGGESEGYIVVSSERDPLDSLQGYAVHVQVENFTADTTVLTADTIAHTADEA
jgi:hypothetical protein